MDLKDGGKGGNLGQNGQGATNGGNGGTKGRAVTGNNHKICNVKDQVMATSWWNNNT